MLVYFFFMSDTHMELEIAGVVVFGQNIPCASVKNHKYSVPVAIKYPGWGAYTCTGEISLWVKPELQGKYHVREDGIGTRAFYSPSSAGC